MRRNGGLTGKWRLNFILVWWRCWTGMLRHYRVIIPTLLPWHKSRSALRRVGCKTTQIQRTKLPEWRAMVLQFKDQAIQAKNEQLVALLEAAVGLLDSGGNPGGVVADLPCAQAQGREPLTNCLDK